MNIIIIVKVKSCDLIFLIKYSYQTRSNKYLDKNIKHLKEIKLKFAFNDSSNIIRNNLTNLK